MPKKYEPTQPLNVRSGPGTEYEIWDVINPGFPVTVLDTTGWLPIIMEDGSIGWCAAQYLKEVTEEPPPVTPSTTPSGGDPPWIAWMKDAEKRGVREVPGSGDNPEIVSWDKLMTTLPASMRHDSTPWCAITVHAAFILSGSGIKPIESALAVDWLKFGQKVSDPQVGDVVVFEWDSGGHHVAFYIEDMGNKIKCLGGNQSDSVSFADYPKANVMGYRRPI